MYICKYLHIYIYLNMSLYICNVTCMYIYIWASLYLYIIFYVHIHIWKINIFMIHILFILKYVYIYIYICTHIYIFIVHIHILYWHCLFYCVFQQLTSNVLIKATAAQDRTRAKRKGKAQGLESPENLTRISNNPHIYTCIYIYMYIFLHVHIYIYICVCMIQVPPN